MLSVGANAFQMFSKNDTGCASRRCLRFLVLRCRSWKACTSSRSEPKRTVTSLFMACLDVLAGLAVDAGQDLFVGPVEVGAGATPSR